MTCPAVIEVITPGPPGPPGTAVIMTGPSVLGRVETTAGGPVALPLGSGLVITGGALTAIGTSLSYGAATRLLSSSTGAGVTLPLVTTTTAGLLPHTWLTGAEAAILPHIHGALAGVVYEHVRNASGAPMAALTPYHVVGSQGDTDRVLVIPANASDPTAMPASGILATALANNEDGHGIVSGVPVGVNTAESPSGTVLYVGNGVLTPTMPAANVQALAIVGRSHASTGTLGMIGGPSLARAAYTGAYGDLIGRPTLGTAAAQDSSAFATAAQGVDAREWIAETVGQAEAEAGVATTRRAWTAQRVQQAIAAWWLTASTSAGRALATAANAAAQRTALGLGGAATLSVGTTAGTVAAGDAPAAAITAHEAAANPHPGYLAPSEIIAGPGLAVDLTTTPGSAIIGAVQNFYAVGNYIMPANTSIQSGVAVVVNTIYLYPFDVLRQIRASELAARIATGVAASSFQLAVYGSTAANLPGAVLASTGDMSGTTAATINSVVTEFMLLPGRIYWWAVNTNGTITFSTPTTGSTYLNSRIGAESLSSVVSGSANALWNRAFSQTYGSWPDLTSQVTTLTTNNRCPNPILRVSAFS